MTKSVGFRLIALLVVAILGVYYIAFDAVGVHVWGKPYTVSVMLPSGGGIYTDASVTYRGVQVGKVSAIHLQPDAVKVDMAIDQGTKIPADVNVAVKELTAAAEQYLELTPPGSASEAVDPPADVDYLKSGMVIPMTGADGKSRVSVPTSVGVLLNSVNTLVDSVHASDLNTIAVAFADGLNQAGPDLRAIVNDGRTLIEALNSEVPATISVIDNGNQVLNTLHATGDNFNALASGLNRLSAIVANDNTNVAAFLRNGGTASTGLDSLLQQTNTANIGLINGLSETAGLANGRQGALQAFFQILPVVASDAALTVDGATGTARFQVTVNGQNTVCPYTSTMLEPTSLVSASSLTRNCAASASDLLQRGADKAPTPGGGTP